MDSLVKHLTLKSDCRSPLFFYERELPVGKTPLDFVQDVAQLMHAHVEAFHCEQEDDEARVGRRVDATIADGDWLILTFSTTFPVEKFLRFVGRRMMTMMPDPERRPNLELFRLWLCLPDAIQQPALFKQVAIDVHPSDVLAAEAKRSKALPPVSSPIKRVLMAAAAPVEPDATEVVVEDKLEERKVGPLFHRRLELAAGRAPQSTHLMAATIQAKRAQSAAPLRVLGASQTTVSSVTGAVLTRPQSSSGASAAAREIAQIAAREEEREFEKQCADAVQSIHSALLKTFAFDKEAATRMLRHVEAVGRTPQLAANDGIPGGPADDLDVGVVLGHSDDGATTFRSGTWRLVPVLIEQTSVSKCANSLASLIQLRFTIRHPFLLAPLALLREGELAYLVSELPTGGPVSLVVRGTSERFTLRSHMRYVAEVAKTVCVALLHLHREGYVHRDLMAKNAFDMGNGQFRLVMTQRLQKLDPSGACSAANIPTRWSSPDALSTGRYTRQDDIWCFGTFLWELLSCAKEAPFSDLVHGDDVPAVLLRGRRLQCPPTADPAFWDRVVVPCFARNEFRAELPHIYDNLVQYLSTL